MTALSERLAQAWTALVGRDTPEPPPTQGQVGDNQFALMLGQWREVFQVSPERYALLADYLRMDRGYIAAILDIAVGAALTFEGNDDTSGDQLSINDGFKIELSGYGTSKPAQVVRQALEDTKLREWLYPIARGLFRDGDQFIEPLVNGTDILGICYHDPRQIIVRRDNKGRLEQGYGDIGGQQTPLAYRQVDGAGKILAGWTPDELIHAKFWPTLLSSYSEKSLITPYRELWTRYDWIQQSQVISRLVRSAPRDVHFVDLTGKSPKEAEEAFKRYVRAYSMQISPGGAAEHQFITPDQNLFIGTGYVPDGSGRALPKLNKVETIDPKGSGFAELGDIKMVLDEMFAQIPSQYVGLQSNQTQGMTGAEVQFGSMIRRFQRAVLERQVIRPIIDLALQLKGFSSKQVKYSVVFCSPIGSPGWMMADAQFRLALAMTSHLQAGTSDRVFWMKRLFGLSEDQAQAEVAKGLAEKELHPIDKGTNTSQAVAGSNSESLQSPDDLVKEVLAS